MSRYTGEEGWAGLGWAGLGWAGREGRLIYGLQSPVGLRTRDPRTSPPSVDPETRGTRGWSRLFIIGQQTPWS